MAAADLKGIKVLVTRPEHQAQGLCQALAQSGATPIPFPVIEITTPKDSNKLLNTLKQLPQYQCLIFISANAAECGLAMLKQHKISLPDGIKVAAVGRSTANKLKAMQVEGVITPAEQFDSEGLLALPELQQVEGKKILIMRGEGGRETLAETLQKRGAEVDYAEVYRRAKPNQNLGDLPDKGVDIAIVTSSEGVENLWQMANHKQQSWLKHLPLVVMSERNRDAARKLGYKADIRIVSQQSDEGLLAAVTAWQQSNKEKSEMTQKSPPSPKKSPEKVARESSVSPALPPTQTNSKEGSGLLRGVVALVLLGGIASAGYVTWGELNTLKRDTQHLANDLQKSVEQSEQRLNDYRQQSQNKISNLSATLEKLQQENALLWQSVRAMEQQSGHDKRHWQLAEAAYLMRLANHRLQLARDIQGATVGLQSADNILKQVADPALLPVREQLARELNQLSSFAQPDLEGISAQLISLAEGARQLPLKGVEVVELQESATPVEVEPGVEWQSMLQRVWAELRTLVVITRNDQPVAPLIPAEQRSYLYQNIELQLESARLALLKGEQQVWQQSLGYAGSWMDDFFDRDKPAVKSSIEILQRLEVIEISPPLPDISASLRILEQQRERLQRSTTPQQGEITL